MATKPPRSSATANAMRRPDPCSDDGRKLGSTRAVCRDILQVVNAIPRQNNSVKNYMSGKNHTGWLHPLVRCSTASALNPVDVAIKRPHKGSDERLQYVTVSVHYRKLKTFLAAQREHPCAKNISGVATSRMMRAAATTNKSQKTLTTSPRNSHWNISHII